MSEPVDMQTRLNLMQTELDDAAKKADAYIAANSLIAEECNSLRTERDELIAMLREILRENYISNSRRKAAYDLVFRLGGYQGKTEGQADEL